MGFLGHTRGSRDDVAISGAEPAAAGRRCFSGRNRGKIRRLTQYKAQCRPSHVRNEARAARVLRLRAPTKESRGNNLHRLSTRSQHTDGIAKIYACLGTHDNSNIQDVRS